MKIQTSSNNNNTTLWQNMSASELEREYSPSSAVGGNYQPFIDEYATRSAASRARCAHIRTLSYGDQPLNKIDCAVVHQDADTAVVRTPLLVYIHGGYWQEGSRTQSFYGADYFLENGIAYAAIGYSLAPDASLTQIVNECRKALACLIANADDLNIDINRIVIAGSSAGAHLSAMCCVDTTSSLNERTSSSPVAGLILLSGIYELEPLVSTYVNDKVAISLEEARTQSPINHTLLAIPKIVITWGENETQEFKRQSRAYAQVLKGNDIAVSTFETPMRNHFNIVHDLANPDSELGRNVLNLAFSI